MTLIFEVFAIAGRAYRLCFDGGVDQGSSGPGGAGEILGHVDSHLHPKECINLIRNWFLLLALSSPDGKNELAKRSDEVIH